MVNFRKGNVFLCICICMYITHTHLHIHIIIDSKYCIVQLTILKSSW